MEKVFDLKTYLKSLREKRQQLTFEIALKEFKENLIGEYYGKEDDKIVAVQYILKFENNWGASVIKSRWSYGTNENLWELALLAFPLGDEDFRVLPKGPGIFKDQEPLGYLTEEDVLNQLNTIKQFSHWSKKNETN